MVSCSMSISLWFFSGLGFSIVSEILSLFFSLLVEIFRSFVSFSLSSSFLSLLESLL